MAKLRHVAFAVKDPRRLYNFYHHLFGVEEARLSEGGSIHVIDGLMNMAFLLRERANPLDEAADQRWGIDHFGFATDNLDAMLARLGDAVDRRQTVQDGRPAEMRIIDPWGNNFDLSSRGFLGREERKLPGVRHVVIHSPQPEDTAEFYTSMLDLTRVGTRQDGSVLLTDGDVAIALTPRQTIRRTGIQCFGVQVDDWEIAQDRFREVGINLPTLQGTETEAPVADPEGNLFLVSERGWQA